jgi:putative DNA primase/helicase
MKFTLYTADCTGNEANCLYPHKAVIKSPGGFRRCRRTRSCDRGIQKQLSLERQLHLRRRHRLGLRQRFFGKPGRLGDAGEAGKEGALADVSFAASPESAQHAAERQLLAASPFSSDRADHSLHGRRRLRSAQEVRNAAFPFFDSKALDAARFLYGAKVKPEDVFWHEGTLTIDEILPDAPDEEAPDEPAVHRRLHPGGEPQQHDVAFRGPCAEAVRRHGQSL